MNWLRRILRNRQINSGQSFTTRQGKVIRTDQSFGAWTSGNLDQMLKAAKTKTNPIDRHFLLLQIVEETYKQRKEKKMRALFKDFAQRHINEFADIVPFLRKEFNNKLPRVPTFQKYSTVLTEDHEFDKAIEICELAINYGLDDGTKSGFEGRIEKIEKKKKPSA